MAVNGIVLAAGQGKRLGGPKALLAWPFAPASRTQPQPLAAVHAQTMLAAGCDEVLVVTRTAWAPLLQPYLPNRCRIVVSHAAAALGPAGSIAAAAAHIQTATCNAVLITPVDLWPVSAHSMQRLLQALENTHTMAAKPHYQGRTGHPITLHSSLLKQFNTRKLPILRDILRKLGQTCIDINVNDPAVLEDIDSPDDWDHTCEHFNEKAVLRFFL